MPIPRRRSTRIALGAAAAIVVVILLAQLLLPKIAAQRVRNELARYGVVHSASVSAFPAIELLWGNAQSATVSTGRLDMGLSQASELLWKAKGIDRVDVNAESMRLGSITMYGVHTQKRGSALYIEGKAAGLQGAFPGIGEVQLLGSAPGGVKMRISSDLLGVSTSTDVLLAAQEGKLVAQPEGLPAAGLVALTLFSDPHIDLLNFNLTQPAATGSGPTYLIRMWAKLH